MHRAMIKQQAEIATITPGEEADILAGLQNARVMIRALAQTLPDVDRLQLSHSFGQRLVRCWWAASCAPALSLIHI